MFEVATLSQVRIKDRIIEELKKGPKTLDELLNVIEAKPSILKGLLTKLVKSGKIQTEEGKYKLTE